MQVTLYIAMKGMISFYVDKGRTGSNDHDFWWQCQLVEKLAWKAFRCLRLDLPNKLQIASKISLSSEPVEKGWWVFSLDHSRIRSI